MSDIEKNFKTDLKRVNWVRTEYAYPIMKKMEESIESLEADNKALTEKVKELENILATYRYSCVTCKRSVEPDECYSLEGTDIMACSEKCLDAYED